MLVHHVWTSITFTRQLCKALVTGGAFFKPSFFLYRNTLCCCYFVLLWYSFSDLNAVHCFPAHLQNTALQRKLRTKRPKRIRRQTERRSMYVTCRSGCWFCTCPTFELLTNTYTTYAVHHRHIYKTFVSYTVSSIMHCIVVKLPRLRAPGAARSTARSCRGTGSLPPAS
jgi:hypothetical protein